MIIWKLESSPGFNHIPNVTILLFIHGVIVIHVYNAKVHKVVTQNTGSHSFWRIQPIRSRRDFNTGCMGLLMVVPIGTFSGDFIG